MDKINEPNKIKHDIRNICHSNSQSTKKDWTKNLYMFESGDHFSHLFQKQAWLPLGN